MSYRLKRKRFNCEQCRREWNQLVGGDIESVICDTCESSCKVINHDVPTASKGAEIPQASRAPYQSNTSGTNQESPSKAPSFEQNLRGAFASPERKQSRPSRQGVRPRGNTNIESAQQAYGLKNNFGEETKRPDSRQSQSTSAAAAMSRSSRFQNGAYRMVFKDNKTKSTHHNKLNLRDTSAEPSNLFGDRNLPRDTIDRDLNDR